MTSVSVVILNYNGCDLLKKLLPIVETCSKGASIVVADNGSTDDSVAVIKTAFPNIELMELGSNFGFCGGYNQALKMVKSDYCVLLNSDVEVTPGWLDPMINILNEHPNVAAVQPKVLSYHERASFEYAGAGGGFIDTLGYPFCRGRLFYAMEEDLGQYNDSCPIFWSSGACMMVRANLYQEVGGLDEDFFAHMEEIDLCWRLQRAGHLIWYEGKSSVYHVGGGTLSVTNPYKTYLNFKNGLSLLYKNLPTVELIYKFPVRIVLDWVAALKFTLSGSGRDGLSVLKAHWHFLSNWGKEIRKRTSSGKLGYRRPSSQYPGSIVWEFFLAGKRKYTQLMP